MQSLAGLLPAAMQEQMYSKNLTLGHPDIMKALYRLFTKSCMVKSMLSVTGPLLRSDSCHLAYKHCLLKCCCPIQEVSPPNSTAYTIHKNHT